VRAFDQDILQPEDNQSKKQQPVPVLELTTDGRPLLYSEKSVHKLAFNDTTKYD
jgi:uncharacterized ParB-like nuclease family protein